MNPDLIAEVENLRAMARELNAAADRLQKVDADGASHTPEAMFPSDQMNTEVIAPALLRIAKAEYDRRALRSEVFDSSYFGEPAWDILLDLYVHGQKGQRVSVNGACIASNCPPTTALRWIGILIADGMVERTDSRRDKRVGWLGLTDNAVEKIEKYLTAQAIAVSSSKMRSSDEDLVLKNGMLSD